MILQIENRTAEQDVKWRKFRRVGKRRFAAFLAAVIAFGNVGTAIPVKAAGGGIRKEAD